MATVQELIGKCLPRNAISRMINRFTNYCPCFLDVVLTLYVAKIQRQINSSSNRQSQ